MSNPYLDRLAKDGINAHGKKSEKKTIKALGARAHRGSGSGRGSKSDATKWKFRCEMKSTTTQSCAVELAWLVKIGQEAVAHGQMPAVVISFVDNQGNLRMANGQWVLVPVSVFKEWCDGRDG